MKTILRIFAAVAIVAVSVVAAGPLFAQHPSSHSTHGTPKDNAGTSSTPANEATKAFEAANDKMHKDMTIAFSGDADVDFMRGMIPHHQGAIDMARIVLQFGKDPEVRKLAEEIVKAQESEIAFMKGWLAKRAK